MRLGATEIEILQSLARGEAPVVSSSQRVRLEMLGLVKDTTLGLQLTPEGRSVADVAEPIPHETVENRERALSINGRKKGPRAIAGI
jgi:hypothetical protein